MQNAMEECEIVKDYIDPELKVNGVPYGVKSTIHARD